MKQMQEEQTSLNDGHHFIILHKVVDVVLMDGEIQEEAYARSDFGDQHQLNHFHQDERK